MMTAPELQALLGVSYRTLLRMRQAGTGPAAYRIGKDWRYRASDVEAWLAARRFSGGAG